VTGLWTGLAAELVGFVAVLLGWSIVAQLDADHLAPKVAR